MLREMGPLKTKIMRRFGPGQAEKKVLSHAIYTREKLENAPNSLFQTIINSLEKQMENKMRYMRQTHLLVFIFKVNKNENFSSRVVNR